MLSTTAPSRLYHRGIQGALKLSNRLALCRLYGSVSERVWTTTYILPVSYMSLPETVISYVDSSDSMNEIGI